MPAYVFADVCISVCNISMFRHRCVCTGEPAVCILSLDMYTCATCMHTWVHSGSFSAHVSASVSFPRWVPSIVGQG